MINPSLVRPDQVDPMLTAGRDPRHVLANVRRAAIRLPQTAVRAWPARRVGMVAVAGLLLLSAALLGHWTPLQAQEGEAPAPEATGASGVTIRIDRLVDRITYTIVDRFQVQLSGLDAATTYEVRVSSDGPRLGLGGCGTSARTQTATVTGETAQDLLFIVWACGLGAGTVTAEVRAAGAATAAVTVSQGVTVLPIPDYVPAAERRAAERSLRGVSSATTPVKTPGIVKNLQHGRFATEIEYTWNEPGSGSFPLSGYGVLMWKGSEDHPGWGEAVNLPTSPRRKRYTGLELDTLYKFRIHACNQDQHSKASYCGWWTDIHEVRTGKKPKPPHTISFDQRSLTSVRAKWSIAADSGGVSRTGFLIRYWPRSNTSDTTTVHVTDKNARRHTLTGLTQGTRYAAKFRTCNDTQSCTVGDWSADHHFETTSPEQVSPNPTVAPTPEAIDPVCPTISGTAVLPANMQVDVVPQPRRLASLCWSPSLFGVSYFVQATDNLSNLDDEDRGDWYNVHSTSEQPHVNAKAQRLQLNLDQIMTKAGKVVGLAENAAYGIRIAMRDDRQRVSYTKAIIIIDTPITRADGAGGTITIRWIPVGTVLASTNYGTGYHELRYRQSDGDHTTDKWTPAFQAPPTTAFRLESNPDEIEGLSLGPMYAVQLVYRDDISKDNASDVDVFAARNAYVWPSNSAPSDGSRVATFPLTRRLSSSRFLYRICGDSFGPPGDQRRAAWETLINGAFQQWSQATNGLVTFGRVLLPCATDAESNVDYNQITAKIKEILVRGAYRTDDQIGGDVREYVDRLRSNGVIRRLHDSDVQQPEILMYDDISLGRLVTVGAFLNIATDIGYTKECWFNSDDTYAPALMCAVPGGQTTDIIVRRGAYDAAPAGQTSPYIKEYVAKSSDKLELPAASASFNKCLNDSDNIYSAFQTMLHEIGHVLGIGGATDGDKYTNGHPLITDSVVNYDWKVLPGSPNGEPDCAPHPFDIMAIFALYQTGFGTS